MCILLKLDYSKFDISNLFFSKLSKKNLLEGSARPPLVQEGLILINIFPRITAFQHRRAFFVFR